jgi:hypothetical protein
MTAPLFTDRDPCGCERALGHVCCPPFARSDDWPLAAELQPCETDGPDIMERTGPYRSAPAGNRGLGRSEPAKAHGKAVS